MDFDVDKIQHGLALRVILAKLSLSDSGLTDAFEEKKDSLARDYFSDLREFGSTFFRGNHRDIQLARILVNRPRLSEQIELFNDMLPHITSSYFGRLLIGTQVPGTPAEAKQIDSAIDYSLYVQSLMFSDFNSVPERVKRAFQNFSTRILRVFGIRGDVTRTAHLWRMAGQINYHHDRPQFQNTLNIIGQLKLRLWFVFGSDPLNAFNRILCPEQVALYTPKESELKALEVMRFRSLYDRYRALFRSSRLFRGYNNLEGEGIKVADRESTERAEASFRSSVPLKMAHHPDGDLFPLVASFVGSIEKGCKNQDYHFVYDKVANLYAIDPSIIPFLDWQLLHELIPADAGIYSVARCFNEMLFLQKNISELNPELQGARNIGSLMGALDVFVTTQRDMGRSQRQFWRTIQSSLPRRAGQMFARSLLKPSHIERIENRLPPQQTEFDDPSDIPAGDEKSMSLRLSLAGEAVRVGIITFADYNRIMDQERSAFTFRWFQKEFAKGRIRIPWALVRRRVTEFVSSIFPETARGQLDQYQDGLDIDFVRRVMRRLSSPFLEDILFEGPAAFDRVLSDNLRHRVIYPRYNSAFLASIGQAGHDIPMDFGWQMSKLKKLIGPSASAIHKAKFAVDTELKAFIDFWLTITERGLLYAALMDGVLEILERQVRSYELDRKKLADDLFHSIQETFSDFIKRGRGHFLNDVCPTLNDIVRSARAEVYESGGQGVIVDSLVNAISDSNEVTAGWIQVVTDTREFQDFTISDVVKMEAAFIHLAKIEDTNIDLICLDRSNPKREKPLTDVRFEGEYFQVVNSIVHNLVSNAIRYSGYGDSVPLTLIAELDGSQFRVSAVNHVAPEARAEAIERYPYAVKLARAEIDVPRGADNNSGFDKIRMACSERMIESIDIDISRFNKRSTQYEVIVTVKHPMGCAEGA
jgi:hypothetical protein